MGEGFLDIPRHGEVDFPSLLVPLNGESAVSFSFRLERALIICSDCLQEVLRMFFADVFDAEVVNHQCK